MRRGKASSAGTPERNGRTAVSRARSPGSAASRSSRPRADSRGPGADGTPGTTECRRFARCARPAALTRNRASGIRARHEGAAPLPRLQISLGPELVEGAGHGIPGYAEVAGEEPGGGKPPAGRQPAVQHHRPELGVELAMEARAPPGRAA